MLRCDKSKRLLTFFGETVKELSAGLKKNKQLFRPFVFFIVSHQLVKHLLDLRVITGVHSIAMKIRDYIHERKKMYQEEGKTIGCRLNIDLYNSLLAVAKKNHWNLSDMMRSGLMKLLEEEKGDSSKTPPKFGLKKINFDVDTSENKSAWK